MSTVFIEKTTKNNEKIEALAQDDAAAIDWINLNEIDKTNFAFDHKRIISDYRKWKQIGGTFWSSKT